MVITKRGKPVNVLLAYDDYKSISSLNQAKDIVFLENFGVDDLTQNKDFIKYTEEMAKDFIKNPSKYPVLSKKFKNLINKRKESNDQNTSHHHH